jgi:hypothetical protein
VTFAALERVAAVLEERLGQKPDGIGASGGPGRLLDRIWVRCIVDHHSRGRGRRGDLFGCGIEGFEPAILAGIQMTRERRDLRFEFVE